MSDKTDFKPKLIKRDKEGYCTLVKGKIHQDDIAILNIYTLSKRAPMFIKRNIIPIKSHIDLTQ